MSRIFGLFLVAGGVLVASRVVSAAECGTTRAPQCGGICAVGAHCIQVFVSSRPTCSCIDDGVMEKVLKDQGARRTNRRTPVAAKPGLGKVAPSGPKDPDPHLTPKIAIDSDRVEGAVDDAFERWSSSWMIDRYRSHSARALMNESRDDAVSVGGKFSFFRAGQLLTIPFSALLQKRGEGYRVARLCYNDTTRGSSDCYSPNDRAAASDDRVLDTERDGESDRDADDRVFRQRLRDRNERETRELREREEANRQQRQADEQARWYEKKAAEERERASARQRPGVQ